MRTVQQLLSEAVSGNHINQYNKGKIEFNAKACFNRGRTVEVMLLSVARNHGFSKDVLELALSAWEEKKAAA